MTGVQTCALPISEISRRYGLDPADIVKLGSNENPYGPSPKVFEALQNVSPERYPEPEELMEGLARYTGFPEEMIVIGAGMDGVMDTLTRLFLEKGDHTFIPTPTFSYYEILTVLAGAEPLFSPRSPDFRICERIADEAKMAFICSPNNPTGNALKEEDLQVERSPRTRPSGGCSHTFFLRLYSAGAQG